MVVRWFENLSGWYICFVFSGRWALPWPPLLPASSSTASMLAESARPEIPPTQTESPEIRSRQILKNIRRSMQIVDGQSTKTNLVGLVHVYPCRGSHLHQCRPVLSVYVQADHIYIQGITYIYIYRARHSTQTKDRHAGVVYIHTFC